MDAVVSSLVFADLSYARGGKDGNKVSGKTRQNKTMQFFAVLYLQKY